jgi:hypothetical protein
MIFAIVAAAVLSAAAAYWLVTQRRVRGSESPSRPTRAAGRSAAVEHASRPAKTGGRSGGADAASRPVKAGGRFAGVEIRTHAGACQAAQALVGQRFLTKDAPALPLAKCTAPRCTCTFSKLPDRRTEGRRLDFGGLHASQFLATNRRTKRDRRRVAPEQS